MSESILDAAQRWKEAIRSRIPENVLRLYHTDASLWGTLSPVIRHGHRDIYEYFVKFLQWEDLQCEFTDGFVRLYDDFAFYSGSYLFTWKVSDKTICVPARFSFIYLKENGEWIIMEHHSSLFPEQPFRIRKYIRK